MYCHLPSFESGGAYWPRLFRWIITVLVLHQIIVLGIILLKEGIAPAVLMVPLPVATLWFYFYCEQYYISIFPHLSVFEAEKPCQYQASHDDYIQPELIVGDVEMDHEEATPNRVPVANSDEQMNSDEHQEHKLTVV